MTGVESGSRSVSHSLVIATAALTRASGSTVGFCRGVCRSLDRIKYGGGVGATCTIAVSRGDSHALLWRVGFPPSRDCHRADMNPIRREEETSVVSHQTGRVESSR